jgi:hypothetical protein
MVVVAVLVVVDVVVDTLQRRFWPSITDIWQELEKDKAVKARLNGSTNACTNGGLDLGLGEHTRDKEEGLM